MRRIVKEDLNRLREQDPNDPAVQQAKALGLTYVGFGRYEDPQTKQVAYINVGGKLVPFNKEVKTNRFQTDHADDLATYNEFVSPEVQQLHELLTNRYAPERYDDDEIDAIQQYTGGLYAEINQRLAELPTGVPSKEIEPRYVGDIIPKMIETMDSALKKGRAPVDFHTYLKLSADYDFNDFLPGRVFVLKGYKNTSINLYNAVNSSENTAKSPAGRNMAMVLQLLVKKNTRGMYISNFSSTPDDYEFLLPRNAVVEIIQEPVPIVGSNALTNELNLEVLYIDCVVKA